jgi:hypothetical protein
MLFVVALLLMVSAVYLFFRLLGDRDVLILASVAPAIVAAFVFGIILILRVFSKEKPAADTHQQ